MNSIKYIPERASQFQAQINDIFKKYANKDLSEGERNDGLRELTIFNEQIETFSFQLEGLDSEAKRQALTVISKFKELSVKIKKGIEDKVPASEFF